MDFTKNGNIYETTFSASTPFNIHIERDGGRVLSVSRRTAGEGWETIEIIRQGRVIDADVYNDIEREFRIQSDVEPTMCEITFGTAVGPDVPDVPDTPTETWIDYTVSGNYEILRINNAKANSLSSLVVGGGCSQNGTPLPTAPQSLVSNKGAISYGALGKNLLEVNDANIVVGSYINNNGAVTASAPNMYFQRFVAVKPSTAYTLSTSKHINYANFMEYDANGVFLKRTLYGTTSAYVGTSVTHTMGDTTAFVIIGSNIDSAAFPTLTTENVKSRNWMFNEGATALPYEAYKAGLTLNGNDEVWLMGKNLSYGELVGKGYASTGGESTSTTFCGNLFKFPCSEGQKYTISWGNLPDGMSGVFINSWNHDGTWKARQAISATDKLTYTITSGVGFVNFTLYKTGGITIGPDTWLQVELGETATPYEPAIAPIKASAEMLLGVGSYADRQDIISGAITRNVGCVILNGSENIGTSNKVFTIGIAGKVRTKTELFCSHYAYSSLASSTCPNETIISFASQNIGIRNDAYTTEEEFRQWLQREYAKGTPVIVVYPLATETTESVTPQSVANPQGEVTIIRDAEVIGLPMEATLKVKKEGGGLKEFTLDGYPYQYEDGMTWQEWSHSDYNVETWMVIDNQVVISNDPWWGNIVLYDASIDSADLGDKPIEAKDYTILEDGIGGGGGM